MNSPIVLFLMFDRDGKAIFASPQILQICCIPSVDHILVFLLVFLQFFIWREIHAKPVFLLVFLQFFIITLDRECPEYNFPLCYLTYCFDQLHVIPIFMTITFKREVRFLGWLEEYKIAFIRFKWIVIWVDFLFYYSSFGRK